MVLVRPRRWSLSHSIPSQGIFAVTLVLVSVRVLVGPWQRARLRGEIGSGVEVEIAWGFGCAVVGVMLIAAHGGRWWDMRRDIVI